MYPAWAALCTGTRQDEETERQAKDCFFFGYLGLSICASTWTVTTNPAVSPFPSLSHEWRACDAVASNRPIWMGSHRRGESGRVDVYVSMRATESVAALPFADGGVGGMVMGVRTC